MEMTVKKSHAHVSPRWFRMNVVQRCPRPRARPTGRYLATVRGETRYPSLASSPAIRFSPQVKLSRHIRRIRARRSASIGGLPGGRRRAPHRQSRRQPARCHLMTASGLTIKTVARRRRNPPATAPIRYRSKRRRGWTLDPSTEDDDLLAKHEVLGDK